MKTTDSRFVLVLAAALGLSAAAWIQPVSSLANEQTSKAKSQGTITQTYCSSMSNQEAISQVCLNSVEGLDVTYISLTYRDGKILYAPILRVKSLESEFNGNYIANETYILHEGIVHSDGVPKVATGILNLRANAPGTESQVVAELDGKDSQGNRIRVNLRRVAELAK